MQTVGHPRRRSGKEAECQCRRHKDVGSVPESGRPPGGGSGNPIQYSCLENPMDTWGHKESAMMRCVHTHTHTHTQTQTHTHRHTHTHTDTHTRRHTHTHTDTQTDTHTETHTHTQTHTHTHTETLTGSVVSRS